MIRKIFIYIAFSLLVCTNIATAQNYYWKILTTTNTELMCKMIYSLSIDREGTVWVGSDDGGMYSGLVSMRYIDDTTFDTRRITTQEAGYVLQIIYCIAIEDTSTNPKTAASVKWIGTPFGLVSYNGSEWNEVQGLPDHFVKCIVIDKYANKWIGTNKGLIKYDGTKMTVYDTSNTKLPSNKIQSLYMDKKNIIWVGTDKGLAKFDSTGWTLFTTENSPLPHNYIFSITEDKEKNIWIGTNGGLAKFDGTSTMKKDWTVYTTKNSKLPHDMIRDILVQENGKAWIATLNGLVTIYDDEWIIYNKENSPLPENKVKQIKVDPEDHIWIGTMGGGVAFLREKK